MASECDVDALIRLRSLCYRHESGYQISPLDREWLIELSLTGRLGELRVIAEGLLQALDTYTR